MSASKGRTALTPAASLHGKGGGEMPIGAVARAALRPSIVRAIASAGDSGRALGAEQRALFRPLIGEGFADARIHTGPAAATTATALGADAFTIGRDVFFARGKFDPGTARGRALLAHELTHVRQQTAPGVGGILGHGDAASTLETEAAAVEAAVGGGALERGQLSIGKLTRSYVTADGGSLPTGARSRLDAISRRALDVARDLLEPDLARTAPTTLPRVRADVSLDLTRLTDDEAARIWGEAIADAVRRELVPHADQSAREVIYRDFEDVQLAPADAPAPAPAQPAPGAVTKVNVYELMSYLSQPEHHAFVMTAAKENLGSADSLKAMGISLRDAVLDNWLSGGPPLSTTQVYNLAFELAQHRGTALLLCHNVLRTFSRGGIDIPWSRHADPEKAKQGYYADGVRAFKPEVIHPSGRLVVIGKAQPRPSIFYVLFSADELGTEDPGDWYHHFAIAVTSHYAATGEMSFDTPATTSYWRPTTTAGRYTGSVVERIVDDFRARTGVSFFDPKQQAAHNAWTWANAVSFLEGAHYGGPQSEVERETLVHRRAAAFGLREAGFKGLLLGFDWYVPKAGTVSVWGAVDDIGEYVSRVIPPKDSIPEAFGAPAEVPPSAGPNPSTAPAERSAPAAATPTASSAGGQLAARIAEDAAGRPETRSGSSGTSPAGGSAGDTGRATTTPARLRSAARPPAGPTVGQPAIPPPAATSATPVQRRVDGPLPPAISSGMLAIMRSDVDRIAAILKQQMILEADERAILAIVAKWAGADEHYRAISGYEGTDYLDRFLVQLKMQTYTRSTARSLWVEQTGLVFDDLWHELEGERLGEFRALLARSRRESTSGPTMERAPSAFDEVIEPVFFKATSLLSFGIVDKELFTGSYEAAMRGGFSAQMEFIGKRVGRAVFDILTLGAGSATYEATERYLEEHPNASWAEASAAGLKAAGNAILPLPEMLTIAKAAGIVASDATELPPDKWQATEAFFQGMLKVISLGAMAKGRSRAAKRRGLREMSASDLHGETHGQPPAGKAGAAGETAPSARVKTPAPSAPVDTNFAATAKGGGWAKHVKALIDEGRLAEAEALERGRAGIAEMLDREFGGKRTGTKRAASDMDVTMPSYEAVAKAKARLVRDLLGLEYEKLAPAEQLAAWDRVHQMLDVSLMTDPTRLTVYEAKGLSWLGRRRVRAAAERAAETQRLRILKGMAEKGNPEAMAELRRAAAERGIDPNGIKPLERIAEADLSPAQRARVDRLKAEIDAAAREFQRRPNEKLGREIVEKQIGLNALDPEAYFDPGAVKAEVTLRDFRGRARALTPEEALGNISNNRVNLATELQKARVRGEAPSATFTRVGGSASFAKYTWRILRTAKAMGIDVPPELLAQAERLYRGKGEAIARELRTDAAREAFARRCFHETRLAQAEAARRIGGRADYRGIAAALAVLDARAGEALEDDDDAE